MHITYYKFISVLLLDSQAVTIDPWSLTKLDFELFWTASLMRFRYPSYVTARFFFVLSIHLHPSRTNDLEGIFGKYIWNKEESNHVSQSQRSSILDHSLSYPFHIIVHACEQRIVERVASWSEHSPRMDYPLKIPVKFEFQFLLLSYHFKWLSLQLYHLNDYHLYSWK